nr:terminase TerL endonuclease subunit [Arcanobacterium phocae]
MALEVKLVHGTYPVLSWMVGNIYVRTDPAGNIKPDKRKSTEENDGVVATIMALDRAIRCGQRTTNGGIYDQRELPVL